MNQNNDISLETAKNIIITALSEFDSELGMRAAKILSDGRHNIVEAPVSKTKIMMQCRPANLTIEYLKAREPSMYMPQEDFEKEYPGFKDQDNLTDSAVIDFEYQGTIYSVAYLAHELGHAIAADVQKGNEHSFRDFSMKEMEEQAYFVQHIVSQYIKDNQSDRRLQVEAVEEKILEEGGHRVDEFNDAGQVFQEAIAKLRGQRKEMIGNALDQRMAP